MEKPFANNSQFLKRHVSSANNMAVHGLIFAPAGLIDHAASPNYIFAIRWHL